MHADPLVHNVLRNLEIKASKATSGAGIRYYNPKLMIFRDT